MRNIKFRAWDIYMKKMFNVDVLAISPCTWDCPDFERNGVSLAYQPNIPVMQYTGLKDVNDSEVFERDILSFITEFEHDTETDQFYGAEKREERCYIVWNDDFSRFDAKTIGRSRMGEGFPLWVLFDGGGYEPKIIGNIYDHPELLEVE